MIINILDLNINIILLFLLINLIVGILNNSKVKSLQDYTLIGKPLTMITLVTCIIKISYGVAFFDLAFIPILCIMLLGIITSLFITGQVLVTRMNKFFNYLSVAELMGNFYGKYVRIIVALIGMLYSIAMTALQVQVISKMMNEVYGIKELYTTIMTIAIMITYAIFRKINSITFTDLVRFFSFVTLIPIVTWLFWKNLPPSSQTLNILYEKFQLIFNVKNNACKDLLMKDYFYIFLIAAIPSCNPAQVQNILLASKTKKTKHAFVYAAGSIFLATLFLLWIIVLFLANQSTSSFFEFTQQIISSYPGLKGFIIIGIATSALSTADLHINAAKILLSHDIAKVVKINYNNELYLIRIGTILVGFLTLLTIPLIQNFTNLLMLLLIYKTVISIPLIMFILGFRSRSKVILSSMIISLIAQGITRYYFSNQLDILIKGIIFAVVANLITTLLIHYILPKVPNTGWIDVNKKVIRLKNTPLKERFNKIFVHIQQFNLLTYLKNDLPKTNAYYVLFSLYIIFTSYCSFYTLSPLHNVWHKYLERGVLYPGLLVAATFIVHVMIAHRTKLIAALLWPLSIFYFSFFVGILMIFVSEFTQLQIIIFMVNIALAVLFYSWWSVLIMCTVGTILALYVFQHFVGLEILAAVFMKFHFSLLYVFLLMFILIGILIKYKQVLNNFLQQIECFKLEQKEYNARQFYKEQQIEMLNNESAIVLEVVKKKLLLDATDKEPIQACIKKRFNDITTYFDTIFHYMKHHLNLVTNLINIDQLLSECMTALKIQNHHSLPYVTMCTQQKVIQCDVEKIKKLLINSIKYSQNHLNNNKDILVYISDTQLGYKFTLLKGKIKKVQALNFIITTEQQHAIQETFYKVVKIVPIKICKKKEDILIAQNRDIVDLHYGYTEIIATPKGITQHYIIPINVHKVSNDIANLSPTLYNQVPMTNTWAVQQEAIFIQTIQNQLNINSDLVVEAMKIMKRYYGFQLRKSGEPSYTHPLMVAQIVLNLTEDQDTIIAGLLHDVVKHTTLTEAGLLTMFGTAITSIIVGSMALHRDIKHIMNTYPDWQEYIKSQDKRIIQVAVADVLHNIRTIEGHSKQKQLTKIHKAITYYAPIAQAIGCVQIAEELIILCNKNTPVNKV